ncbi:hypothetical protein LCGC14_2710950, partial [marine sediment metagenome]
MKPAYVAMAMVLAAGAARAEVVGQRWAAGGVKCAHPGTLKIDRIQAGTQLTFDLSAIPKRARIYHASLYCSTSRGRQPTEP